jgi:hypothetical protein
LDESCDFKLIMSFNHGYLIQIFKVHQSWNLTW